MKITVVTVCRNASATIEDTLRSVAAQDYPNIEHIVIDGGSTDDTLEIVKRFPHVTSIVTEPDEGIYDAMNKGLGLARGDAVGFLNSDDFFSRTDSLSILAAGLEGVDAVVANVALVARDDISRVKRFYSIRGYRTWMLRFGHMPPHPTLYVRTPLIRSLGGFDKAYRIAGDFEFVVRLILKCAAKIRYVPQTIVGFRAGGVSTKNIRAKVVMNQEILHALQENGVSTSTAQLYLRYCAKWIQAISRPRDYRAPAFLDRSL